MTDALAVPAQVRGYHAHVFYDAGTRPAVQFRQTIGSKFAVEFGPLSDEPRGLHPISQFDVIFKTEQFQNLVPWRMLNRERLNVLVHPLTESSYDDDSRNALWLGTQVPLRIDVLLPTYRPERFPTA